jgi:hypothetical protein
MLPECNLPFALVLLPAFAIIRKRTVELSTEEQGHALRLVCGATTHLLSIALCVSRAPVYDAAGCALTVRLAAQTVEDRT